MATTYSMQITKIQVKWDDTTFQNVVTAISFNMIAISDDGIKKMMEKQIPLPPPTSPDFIPISEITEEIVTEWVLNNPEYLNESDKNIFEIRFQMEREKTHTECYNFPFLTSSIYPYAYMN